MAGTPEYLSPEQASGEHLDARSDVFTLGAILYEVLTGSAPFRAENARDLLRRIREEDPPPPRRIDPAIPKDLQDICASIPRQMKNFLVSGLVFLAIGVYRLQQEVFPGRAWWPILLLAAGLGLMLAAANYAALRVALARMWKRPVS